MLEQSRHLQLRRIVVLLLAFTVLATYMPQAALPAYAATKASVYDGKTLKGSDGKPYYPNQKGCNTDDWYWATQNIIWEFQQGLRTSVDSGLKARTGKYAMGANWFRDTVKGRPAGKIYDWMLSQMKKYVDIPSFTVKDADKIRSKHTIKLEPQADGTWVGTAKDTRNVNQDIRSTNKNRLIV